MRQYEQLIEEDRIEIDAMKQAAFKQTQMAQRPGYHCSTVSRELAHNTGGCGYGRQYQ